MTIRYGIYLKIEARAGLSLYSELLGDLKKSSYINADETEWKLDGVNHWLWKFAGRKVSITHINRSRGSRVVEDILGKKYDGVLISDFLSAYNKIDAKAKQKCIVHLKRDLLKISKRYSCDKSILRYVKSKVTPIVKTKYLLSYSYTFILETIRSLLKYISAGGQYPEPNVVFHYCKS